MGPLPVQAPSRPSSKVIDAQAGSAGQLLQALPQVPPKVQARAASQVPQLPPQPSSPHCFWLQSGVQVALH